MKGDFKDDMKWKNNLPFIKDPYSIISKVSPSSRLEWNISTNRNPDEAGSGVTLSCRFSHTCQSNPE